MPCGGSWSFWCARWLPSLRLLAGPNAAGDGVLELKAVYGRVMIGKPLQPAHGLLWGQMDNGKLIVEDPVLGDGRILVTGWENKVFTPRRPSTALRRRRRTPAPTSTSALPAAIPPRLPRLGHRPDGDRRRRCLLSMRARTRSTPGTTPSTQATGSQRRSTRQGGAVRRPAHAAGRALVNAPTPSILVVEDESSIASFVVAVSEERRLRSPDGCDRG